MRSGRVAMGAALILMIGVAGCRSVDDIATPDAELVDIAVRRYSGGRAMLEIRLHVSNPNDFAVRLTDLGGELALGGTTIGPVSWSGETLLHPGEGGDTIVPAEFETAGRDPIFSSLIDGQPIQATVSGAMTLARGVMARSVPLVASGRLPARP